LHEFCRSREESAIQVETLGGAIAGKGDVGPGVERQRGKDTHGSIRLFGAHVACRNGFASGKRSALMCIEAVRQRTSKEIAQLIGLSAKTAESYRARVMDKLDIHHTAELVRYAIREGLVEM
jgi:hypothetical protein